MTPRSLFESCEENGAADWDICLSKLVMIDEEDSFSGILDIPVLGFASREDNKEVSLLLQTDDAEKVLNELGDKCKLIKDPDAKSFVVNLYSRCEQSHHGTFTATHPEGSTAKLNNDWMDSITEVRRMRAKLGVAEDDKTPESKHAEFVMGFMRQRGWTLTPLEPEELVF